jgi:hypothetical protein
VVRRSPLLFAACCLAAAACSGDPFDPHNGTTTDLASAGAAVASVINNADAGPGSLRAALERASADPSVHTIRIEGDLAPIELASPLVYSGAQALDLDGQGAVIHGPSCASCAGLLASGGASLTLRRFTMEGAAGTGIVVEVPASATGEIEVRIQDLVVRDNGLHGVLVDDQVFNSSASLLVDVSGSTIEGNGFVGATDFDGLRVNEGGTGSLHARIQGSSFLGNGADGVELDETGDGDVTLDAQQAHFDENGPRDPEDLDDGLDVDEVGEGDIRISMVQVTVNGNFDEGLDFNEGDGGNLLVTLSQVVATDNVDENIAYEELAAGSIDTKLTGVVASGSQTNDGIQFEEFGDGNLTAILIQTVANDNEEGDGIKAEQEAPGAGTLRLNAVTAVGNGDDPIDVEGVEVIQ